QKASYMPVENLDYLGLVAGLIDRIGILQKINELVGEQPGEIVSPGLVVKAMIIFMIRDGFRPTILII
ncbi:MULTISPECIES: DUF4277 domain-containing protein, partial [unclassified Microcoleus]|uniref:DUF4277 domain-containing protein n=1 Tax=Microcoleus sp. Aus8_D3 TaxID=2818633 RepID=UPI002FD3DF8F